MLASAPALLQPTERPQWEGSNLTDGILLLIADQGYGDVIQFARYIPWAAARCPQRAIACSSELPAVITQQPGAAMLFAHWDRPPAFGAHCPPSIFPPLAATRPVPIPRPLPP